MKKLVFLLGVFCFSHLSLGQVVYDAQDKAIFSTDFISICQATGNLAFHETWSSATGELDILGSKRLIGHSTFIGANVRLDESHFVHDDDPMFRSGGILGEQYGGVHVAVRATDGFDKFVGFYVSVGGMRNKQEINGEDATFTQDIAANAGVLFIVKKLNGSIEWHYQPNLEISDVKASFFYRWFGTEVSNFALSTYIDAKYRYFNEEDFYQTTEFGIQGKLNSDVHVMLRLGMELQNFNLGNGAGNEQCWSPRISLRFNFGEFER